MHPGLDSWRVTVLGMCGVGKSTLSVQVRAEALDG